MMEEKKTIKERFIDFWADPKNKVACGIGLLGLGYIANKRARNQAFTNGFGVGYINGKSEAFERVALNTTEKIIDETTK